MSRGARRRGAVLSDAGTIENAKALTAAPSVDNLLCVNQGQRDFTLSGSYGGLLAGRGGYTVVNLSTFRLGKPAVNSADYGNQSIFSKIVTMQGLDRGDYRKATYSNLSNKVLGDSVDSGWKTGSGMAGSFKTQFQYSNPSSLQNATKLIGFNAQQSLGWNGLAHRAKYFETGARFSFDGSFIAGFVMEQRYASSDGLFRPLSDTGLAVGALGDALSLAGLGLAAKQGFFDDLLMPSVNKFTSNGFNAPGSIGKITTGGGARLAWSGRRYPGRRRRLPDER